MRQSKFILSALLLCLTATNSCAQVNSPGTSSVRRVFVASTPCSQGTRPVPGIPINADCTLIKWNLTLFLDESGSAPATYKLHCVYGQPQQGTTGFIGGGEKVDMKGEWTIGKGTPENPHSIVYRLTDDKTHKTICFLKLNDNLLHLLDNKQQLMIGSAAWSYTLNRTGSK
jgi:hypothetical protein